MDKNIPSPKTRFLKVRCKKCKNEQIIFGSASTQVNCLVCGTELAEPQSGKAQIKTTILNVLE